MSYAKPLRLPALGTAAWITAAQELATHDAALTEYTNLNTAIAKLDPSWSALPVTPYPPASDTTGVFPETGTTALLVRASSVSALQLAEPAKAAASLTAQATARRPAVTPLFWIGLAAACAGYFISKR